MTKTLNGCTKRRVGLISVVSVLLILAITLAAILLHNHFGTESENDLKAYQEEILQRLEDDRGEYDESSIVLSGTNLSVARKLAERLNAELRITEDGSFAKLSLPDGVTIADVCADDDYLKDLRRISIDYQVSISAIDMGGENEGVEYIPTRPDYNVTDGSYDLQTYLDYINMQNIWSSATGSGITIAIIDTGIDTDHPEFTGRISEYSYNATEDKIVKDYVLEDGSYDWSLIEDEQGHGTAVAGVLAASMNDGQIIGVAPKAKILVIKAECTEEGNFKNASDLVFGLYYAIERDVSVVNMSFGMQAESEINNIFADATLLAHDSDVICVASAGNDAISGLVYPAADKYVFGVGALAEDSWELADYSNYGESVNLVAPGTTYTSIMGGGYGTMSGTSMSAPVVAGSIALYLNKNRYQESRDVEELLYASCRDLGDLGEDWYFGYGALDVSAFILEERGTVTFNMLSDELDNIQKTFIRNHTLQEIPMPERLYAVFDGWYYDAQCTEEYNWYVDEFSSDLTLYAKWVNEDDGIPYTYAELDDGTIEILSYIGKRRFITIPEYIDGKLVSSIGKGAFAGNTRIREVGLPKSITRISDDAFNGCASLVSIKIPDAVTYIGEKAFYDNVRLSSVEIGSGSKLQTIGALAFSGCSKLRSFTIPASLTHFDESAFYKCNSITSFDVHKGNKVYKGVDGAICNIDATRLICYPYGRTAKAVIPASVTTLGTYSFRYAKLQGIESWGGAKTIEELAFERSAIRGDLVIPDQITSMGAYAFTYNSYIITLTFGNGLTEIPSGAFNESTSLRKINLSDSIKVIGGDAFYKCVSLPELYIPASVEKLAGFDDCYQLSSLTFAANSNLKEIGEFSFTKIKSLSFPSKLETINAEAFWAAHVSSVSFAKGSVLAKIYDKAFEDTYVSSIVFPESLEYLGSSAFASTPLSSIVIPKNLSHFGGGAFAGCDSLPAIEVVDANPYYNDINGVVYTESGDTIVAYPSGSTSTSYDILAGIKKVGASSFAGSAYLQNLTIPAGTETICTEAFSGSSVVTIQIGSGLKTIETWGFINAINLTTVNLPEGLTTVGAEAFFRTDSLNKLVIPESLTVLTERSFYGCGARSYTLPTSLTEIESEALAFNKNLRSITIPDNVTQIGQYAFYGNYSMSTLTIRESTKMTRFSFGAFANCGITSLRIPANISTISQGVFMDCIKLKTVTFSAGSKLPSISAYMFDGCSNLKTITFEQGSALTSIQAHALEGMRKLTTLDIGDAKLTNIDNFAFRFCESLTEFTIPEGVTNIGRFAFYNCSGLAKVTLPSTLEHIGRFAFLGTNNVDLYFASESLPEYLDEDWDHQVRGYYLGVTDVKSEGDWTYAVLSSGGIALIEYLGSDKVIDLTKLNLGGDIVNIGGECFSYSEVEEVVIPNTVVNIQAEAFYHSNLKSVTIPSGVQFIGRAAFADTPITSLSFAKGSAIKVIEQSAFEGTTLLSGVTLPASLTTLGSAAFKNSGIAYVNFADGIKITEIPEEAFAYTNITSVSIPDSVSLINHSAFRETAKLSSVAFGSADDIMIMSNAFYHSGLKTLYIPENVSYIGEYAFVALTNLKKFEVAENNPNYSAVDGVLMGSAGRKIIAMPAGRTGSYTLPVAVEIIGFGAFEETKLSEIKFNENANILSLGYRAFYKAENITHIHIPASVIGIDYYAFANCTNLKKVTFADNSGLKGIYEGAFYGCKNLSDITVPDSIVEISDFAFYGCAKLNRIPISETTGLKGLYGYSMAYTGISGEFTVPETLIDVGEYAFLGTKITKIIIPDTNAWDLMIGIGAFEDCKNVSEIITPFIGASFEDNEIGWLGYIFGAGGYEANEVYVPEALKKVTVTDGLTEIGAGAFYGIKSLEEIDLPHSITVLGIDSFGGTTARYTLTNSILGRTSRYGNSVYSLDSSMFGSGFYGHLTIDDGVSSLGWYPFRNLTELTGVTIGKGIEIIPMYAFEGCTNLTEVVIPDTVKSIENGAFEDCASLTTVYIGSGVESISSSLFRGCDNITDITVSKDNPYYQAIDGVLYDKPVTKFVFIPSILPSKITIPEGITDIPLNAFESDLLSEVVLPDSVKTIGSYSFRCPNLYTITLGSGLATIDKDAFLYAKSLYTVYNNSGLDLSIGSQTHGKVAYYAELIISANGNKTYRDPSSGFEMIDTADGFKFVKKGGEYYLLSYTGDEKSITLPSSINNLSYKIDSFVSLLEEITISDGVSSINSNAFSGCVALKRFNVETDNTAYKVVDGILYDFNLTKIISIPKKITGRITIPGTVKQITNYAFAEMTGITHVTVSEGVKSLGSGAFQDCANLVSVVIPGTISEIPWKAFENCTSLESLIIPEGTKTIGYDAFRGCTSLSSISLPNSLTTIDSQAFYGCKSLSYISLPNGLTDIGSAAFLGCGIESVVIPSSIQSLGKSSFGSNVEIIFPENIKVVDGIAYGNDMTTMVYITPSVSGKVTIPDGITAIPASVFSGMSISEIVIPESVTNIEYCAFSGCEMLKKITLPSSLTAIGNNAFDGCISLESITLPASITTIPMHTFFNCTSLKEIVIPEGVIRIDNNAFSGCINLRKVHFPASLIDCAEYAFSNNHESIVFTADDGFTAWTNIDGIWYNKEQTTIIHVPSNIEGDIVIPEGVTAIGSSLWACSNVTSITLPDSYSPNNISFSGMSQLREIIVSDTHPNYSSVDGILYNKEKTELLVVPDGYIKDTLDIPEGVVTISVRLNSNSAIRQIVLPSTLNAIDTFAFWHSNIEVVYNNSSLVLEFGNLSNYGGVANNAKLIVEADGTKRYAKGITDYEIFTTDDGFVFKKENGEYFLTGYLGDKDSVTLPESVNGASYKLYEFKGASHVIIPDGWTHISDYAFSDSRKLRSITIPTTVTTIGERAFFNCFNLESITLHEGIESIGQNAFAYSGLSSIEFPSSLTTIDVGAFSSCDFETVRIPATIKVINSSAFSSCKNLTNVILEEGVTVIDGFNDCTSLTKIVIPDSATIIGSSAFEGCTALAEIVIPDSATIIGSSAFEGCTALAEIVIPNSVTSIGKEAFLDCENLSSIFAGNKITSIGEKAFYNTAFYNDLDNWTNGILYLSNYLIRVAEDIKFFDLMEGAGCIANDAYQNCYKLKIAYVRGNALDILSTATNIETVVIVNDLPDNFVEYFGRNISAIPITLKNIVLSEGITMKDNVFGNKYYGYLSGYKFFVEDTMKDTMWDENYPDWQVGNGVYYGDKWIYSDFYGENGQPIIKNIVLNSQIVRLPWTDNYYDFTYAYVFLGYDVDGDGTPDSVPATSTVDISGNAIYEKIHRCVYEGHSVVVDAAVAPTCTETGLTEGSHCGRCGEIFVAQNMISALGHNAVVDKAVMATCTVTGLTEGSHCERCDTILIEQKIVPIVSHTYDDKYDEICNVCGFVRNVECDHPETVLVQGYAATCTKQGMTDGYNCARCGEVIVAQTKIKALGHNSVIDKSVEPTCTATGLTAGSHCDRCGVILAKQETIPSLEHNIVFDEPVEPTCTTEGLTEGSHCDTCGMVFQKPTKIPVTSHTYDSASDESCNVCGFIRDIACVHDNIAIIQGVDPTCTEAGLSSSFVCADCGEIFMKHTAIPALGHNIVTDKAVEPTCLSSGLAEGSHCDRCGIVVVEQSVVPALGHDIVAIKGVEPTCTKTGLTEGSRCDRCDCILVAQSVLSPTNHTIVSDAAVEPTCTTEGLTAGAHCEKCGRVITAQKQIPMKEHTYSDDNDDSCNVCGKIRDLSGGNSGDLDNDEFTTALFKEAVRDIAYYEDMSAKYDQLYYALYVYSNLSENEKSRVEDSYSILERAVEQYNSQAAEVNNAMAEATELSFSVMIPFNFAFLSALWFLLRKKFIL